MTIRIAQPADLDAIEALERDIFPDDAWPRDKLDDDLRSPYARFVVTEDDGLVVGYAIGHHLPGNDVADIHNIAVRDSHRGRGLGSALFDDLVAWSTSRGASAIMLEVRADNEPAQALYRSRGFDVIATRPNYYQPAGVDAFVMRWEVPA